MTAEKEIVTVTVIALNERMRTIRLDVTGKTPEQKVDVVENAAALLARNLYGVKTKARDGGRG